MFFIPLFTALFVLGTYWQQTAFLVALAAPAQRDGVAGDLESIDIPVGPTQGIVSDSGFLRGPPSSPHLLARQTYTQCCSAYLCCYADQVCYLDFQSVPQCCPSSWVKCGDNGCFCCPNGSSCAGSSQATTQFAVPVTVTATPTSSAGTSDSGGGGLSTSTLITIVVPIVGVVLGGLSAWIAWKTYKHQKNS